MAIAEPPVLQNKSGEIRKVGYELEFTGPDIRKVSELIRETYGGEVKKVNRYEYQVGDTDLGDFRVELDARILQKMAGKNLFKQFGLDLDEQKIRESLEDVIDKLAKKVVPMEVVMPPLPVTGLQQLEKLRKKLQGHKAKGTTTSLAHAFGMHINIETPELEVDTLLRYLRSFLLLYPWLLTKLEVDFSRRISPFVDPFPVPYVRKVLEAGYHPGQQEFIDDYLAYNGTRNRPLDMLPILAMLDGQAVAAVVKDAKNNPRPTFHYRLPNSHVDDPGWKFSDEWNYWCEVEKLADNSEMISKLSRLYVFREGKSLVSFKKEWTETITILLDLDEQGER